MKDAKMHDRYEVVIIMNGFIATNGSFQIHSHLIHWWYKIFTAVDKKEEEFNKVKMY